MLCVNLEGGLSRIAIIIPSYTQTAFIDLIADVYLRVVSNI